jgi:thermostable 8-oxoguanine DNA glycosylase
MKAKWTINESALVPWRRIVEENKHKGVPTERLKKNVNRQGIVLTKNAVWRTLLGCQITSAQRSGPDSLVSKFMKSNSKALVYAECRTQPDLKNFIKKEIKQLRFNERISDNLSEIFTYLEDGGWIELLTELKAIEKDTTKEKERKVIEHIAAGNFPGLGPKQARNFIQWLGLSQYVIPLDTRIFKKMKEYGVSPVPKKGEGMSEEPLYRFFEDGMQEIAQRIGVLPCMLDACIFASFDDS